MDKVVYLVEYLVKQIVKYPDNVTVEQSGDEGTFSVINITVDEKDRLKRIKNRKTLNRLDEETLAIDYFKNNLLYLEMLKNMSAANIYVINTSKYDMDIIVNKIINIIEKE